LSVIKPVSELTTAMSAFVMPTVRRLVLRSLPLGMRLIGGATVLEDTDIWKRLPQVHACGVRNIVSARLSAGARETKADCRPSAAGARLNGTLRKAEFHIAILDRHRRALQIHHCLQS